MTGDNAPKEVLCWVRIGTPLHDGMRVVTDEELAGMVAGGANVVLRAMGLEEFDICTIAAEITTARNAGKGTDR